MAEIEFYGTGSINVANATSYDTIATVLAGNGGINKYGAGYLTLSGSNTYTGPTGIYNGTLQATTLANGGSNGSIGASTNAAANIVLNGGSLRYIGTGESSDRLFTLGTSASHIYSSGNGALTLSNTGAIAYSGSGTRSLEIRGNYNGINVFAPVLADGTGGATSIIANCSGGGTWALTGANTYTGTTTITAGTLSIGNNGTTGAISNSSSVTDNATLQFYRSNTYTYTGAITGSGAVTQAGSGTTNLSSTSNAWAGATTVSAGTLQLGASGVIPDGAGKGNVSLTGTLDLNGYSEGINGLSGAGTVTSGAAGSPVLTVGNSNAASTFSGAIVNGSGTVALTKAGSGTLTLAGTNTFTGTTTINATGTLTIGNGTTNGAISNSSNVTDNGTLTFNRSNSYTYTGAITGTGGAVIQAGSGTTNISNTSNAWTGATTISAGTLQLGASGVIPDGSAVSLGSGAGTTFDLNSYAETVGSISGGGATGGNITLGSAILTCGGDNTSPTYSGVISGTGGLTKVGSGTLTLSGTSTYSGVTTFNAGTVSITSLANGGANSNIGAAANTAGNLVLNGGTLSYVGGALTCNRLFSVGTSGGTIASSGSGALNLSNTGSMGFTGGTGARTLTLGGTQTGNNTLAALIADNTGATAIAKSGAGTWILTNANTCSGAVSVSNGILLVNNTSGSGTGTGAVSVSSGGTLGGSGAVSGLVTVGGGTISPGTSAGGTAILSLGNGLTFTSGTYSADLDGTIAGTNYDQAAVTGAAALGAGVTALSITLHYIPITGDAYTIISTTTGVTGTFTNLLNGATDTVGYNGNFYKFTISYAGNNVVLTAAGLANENYANWLYSQKIFINTSTGGAQTGTTLYNFPLLVRLDSTRFYHFYQTATGGADIRFAGSKGEQLPYQIERWKDNTGDNDSAAIWVNVDSIQPNSWSNYITMYWGNSSASSMSNGANVFTTANGFVGVWHLSETGNSNVDGYADATGNAANAQGSNFSAGNETAATIGLGQTFVNASSRYITVKTAAEPDFDITGAITISAWINVSSWTTAWQAILTKGDGAWRLARNNTNGNLSFDCTGLTTHSTIVGNTTLSTGTPYLVTGVYDGSYLRMYLNGARQRHRTRGNGFHQHK